MDPIVLKQLAMKSCSVDNIRIMRGQVVRLTMIRDMALADMREAERSIGNTRLTDLFNGKSKSSASLVNNVLFGLQMVKATCDVVIAVAGEWSGAAKPISTVYSGLTPNAENLGKLAAGDKVGAADFAKGANAGLNTVIKKRLGTDSPVEDLADLNKVKADILINATAYDEKALLASLVDYGVVLGSWAVKAAGKEGMSKVIKTGDEIRKAGLAYHAAYKEWKDGDMSSNFDAGIKMVRKQVETITRQIQTLESNLAACGAEMPKFRSSAIDLVKKGKPSGPAFRAAR